MALYYHAAIALSAGLFAFGTNVPAVSAAEIAIGTGSPSGVYYQVGRAICRIVERVDPIEGLTCEARPTPGSIHNLQNVRSGDLQIGVVQSDWHYHAVNGSSLFADAGADGELRSLFSMHGEPQHAFPYFLGGENERGEGPGAGLNRNYPMPAGTPYSRWVEALDDAADLIRRYQPDALVISLGVDTFKDDPISFFKLESGDFTRMGQRIRAIGMPTLFVMEGGYAVAEIGINTVNVLAGFEDG